MLPRARTALRYKRGTVKQILSADKADLRFRQEKAGTKPRLGKQDARAGDGAVIALANGFPGWIGGRQCNLERTLVFFKDIGETFELPCVGSKENDGGFLLTQVERLLDGLFHVAVKSEAGPRGNVQRCAWRGNRRGEIKFVEGDPRGLGKGLPPFRFT